MTDGLFRILVPRGRLTSYCKSGMSQTWGAESSASLTASSLTLFNRRPSVSVLARMTPSPLGVRRVSPTTPGTVATPLLSRQRSVPASATHEMDSSGSLLPPELISRKIQSTEGLPSPAPAPRLGNGSPLSSRRPGLASPKVASDMASEFSTRQSTMLAHDPSKSTVSESSVVCDRNGKGLGLPARRRLAAARGTLKIATNAAVRQDYQTESYVHSSSGSPSIRRRTPKRQVCAGLVRPSSCGGRKERNGEGIACEKSFVDGKWNDSGQQGEQSTSRRCVLNGCRQEGDLRQHGSTDSAKTTDSPFSFVRERCLC